MIMFSKRNVLFADSNTVRRCIFFGPETQKENGTLSVPFSFWLRRRGLRLVVSELCSDERSSLGRQHKNLPAADFWLPKPPNQREKNVKLCLAFFLTMIWWWAVFALSPIKYQPYFVNLPSKRPCPRFLRDKEYPAPLRLR